MAAGPDDLCTLADLKAWLPNQGSNDDTNLQALITDGSAIILNEYMNRPHILSSVLGTVSDTYDGNGSDRLLPKSFPIISVSAVTIDSASIPASTGPLVAGFTFDARRVLLRGFRFCRGVQNVSLTYTAGYSSVPVDLKRAAIEAFALAYRQRTHIGEKSNSLGGRVTIRFDMSAVPPRSMTVFNQYRRLAMP